MPTPAATSTFTTDASAAIPGPAWAVARRAGAAAQLVELPMPTTEEEVWRYSRVGDLDLAAFRPIADPVPLRAATELANDAAAAGVSLVVETAAGVVVQRQGDTALLGDPDDAGHVGTLFSAHDQLAGLHEAFARPLRIVVPAGQDAGTVVVVHGFDGAGAAAFPRTTVEVGQGAAVEVVEVHVSDAAAHLLTVPVTELLVGRDASLRHGTLQVLGEQTWQIGTQTASVEQGGTLRTGALALGGHYARLRVDTRLAGRGASADVIAGFVGNGDQLLDFRTFQDHAAPDTTSNLLFKGALGERGASVYTGLIKIRPEGRGSTAYQTNRNLKLSDEAWAESVPNLEIENNDVRCSHASTVSPVDPEQRFYVESRGVPSGRAERLIVRGFFDEVLDAIPAGPFGALLRARLEDALERSLP